MPALHRHCCNTEIYQLCCEIHFGKMAETPPRELQFKTAIRFRGEFPALPQRRQATREFHIELRHCGSTGEYQCLVSSTPTSTVTIRQLLLPALWQHGIAPVLRVYNCRTLLIPQSTNFVQKSISGILAEWPRENSSSKNKPKILGKGQCAYNRVTGTMPNFYKKI